MYYFTFWEQKHSIVINQQEANWFSNSLALCFTNYQHPGANTKMLVEGFIPKKHLFSGYFNFFAKKNHILTCIWSAQHSWSKCTTPFFPDHPCQFSLIISFLRPLYFCTLQLSFINVHNTVQQGLLTNSNSFVRNLAWSLHCLPWIQKWWGLRWPGQLKEKNPSSC